MWHCRNPLTFALAFCALSAAVAQDAVTLRIREKPGEVYHQTIRFNMSMQLASLPEEAQALLGAMMEGEQSLSGVVSVRTRVVSSNGGRTTLRRVVRPVSVKGEGFFAMATEAMEQQFSTITEEVLDKFGVQVSTRVISGATPTQPGGQAAPSLFGAEPQAGLFFPRHAVKPGDVWTTKDPTGRDIRIRFFDWEEWHSIRAVRLEVTGDFAADPGVNLVGPLVFLIDPATGRPLLMTMALAVDQAGTKMNFQMRMEMDAPR